MTIPKYLYRLEYLQHRRDRCLKRYLKMRDRATAPASAHISTDGVPASRSGRNGREDLLIDVADAWAEYCEALREYSAFADQLDNHLELLEIRHGWPERAALEIVYIDNMGKPPERRIVGVCRHCDRRTRAEAAALIEKAKQHLTEILREQGEIEDDQKE